MRAEESYCRKQRYNKAQGNLLNEEYIAKHAVDPPLSLEEQIEQQLEHEAVRAAVEDLPLLLRKRVYASYYFLGYTMAEIAKSEGVTVQAISKSLIESRSILKEILEDLI